MDKKKSINGNGSESEASNLPHIMSGRSLMISPIVHKEQAKLNRSFMNEDRQNRIAFSPPNITAFKKSETGG